MAFSLSGVEDAVTEESGVPGGFTDISLGPIDLCQSGSGIDRDMVGAAADDETVPLMGIEKALMAGAAYGMVDGWELGELRKERSWISGQRVEGSLIYSPDHALALLSAMQVEDLKYLRHIPSTV